VTGAEPQPRGLVSLILATYNERENIREMLDRIFLHVPAPVEVIVVDDDSPDGTWQVVAQLRDPRVHLVRRRSARGLASAILRGIIESRGEIIGWWDTDMLMAPERFPAMMAALGKCDIAIGSRYVAGGGDDRHPVRVWTSRLLNRLASLVLGQGIRDYDSGFILFRRSVLDTCVPVPTGFGEYFIEFMYCCRRRGLTVAEIPYRLSDRTGGISKCYPSVGGFLTTGMRYVLRIAIARVRGGG
jgi:dolichol-phosphate mannosyltransferase